MSHKRRVGHFLSVMSMFRARKWPICKTLNLRGFIAACGRFAGTPVAIYGQVRKPDVPRSQTVRGFRLSPGCDSR